MLTTILFAAQLSISLSATKTTVGVGEGTRLVERWTSDEPVDVILGGGLYLDDGSGFRPFIPKTFQDSTTLDMPVRLGVGRGLLVNHDILIEALDAERMRMTFWRPGVFRFEIRTRSLVSNTVQVTVLASADPQVSTILAHPELTSWLVRVDPQLRPIAQALMEGGPLRPLTTPIWLSLSRSILEEASVSEARVHLETLRSTNWADSAFGDQVSLLIAEWTSRLLDKEVARQRYEDVIRGYPNSASAEIARSWLVAHRFDTSAPTILATPTPTFLWPPNKKMISVAVNVKSSDDSGDAPTLKLVSIVCNDICDPSRDISGAVFGTDDRAFQLRADRTGGGSGRTYVITYEATDAAGNKTRASTTVRVPHDQGKD